MDDLKKEALARLAGQPLYTGVPKQAPPELSALEQALNRLCNKPVGARVTMPDPSNPNVRDLGLWLGKRF
jgi:hypothetical protein